MARFQLIDSSACAARTWSRSSICVYCLNAQCARQAITLLRTPDGHSSASEVIQASSAHMQMNGKDTASQLSQDAAAETVPQASGTDSKLLSAKDEAITEQPSHEIPSHSHGSTAAEQEQKPAAPAPQADVKDTELQRRKAALLQQVEEALAEAEASPASATSKMETPVDADMKQTSPESKPEQPEPLHIRPAAALPPRKPKLQPGDFYITLPKPPLAEPNPPKAEPALQPNEHTGPETVSPMPSAETSQEDGSAAGLCATEPTGVFDPGQAADAGSRTAHRGPDALPKDSCVLAVGNAEAQPSSSPDLPGKHPSVPSIPEMPVLAPSAGSGIGADAVQQSTPSRAPATLEPLPERNFSAGTRYGAAAARKEEAQELALEQAILEVHWRHADEEAASEEGESEELAGDALDVDGTAASISYPPADVTQEQQTWQQSRTAQHPSAYVAHPGSSYPHTGVGDWSSAGTPWSDWTAVEGSAAPRAAASNQAGYKSTDEAAAKGASGHETASGQCSPAQLAAQAKAWADWAAWQAQSTAQPAESGTHAWPSAATAQSGSAPGQSASIDMASDMPAQPADAELAAQAKAWADWAGRQTQHAAQAQDQGNAPQPAGPQQGASQASQTAQARDSEMVNVPASLYKRYQALEWAEWQRQYESWQAQYNSWHACYKHWYSSYLAWYNVHGGS